MSDDYSLRRAVLTALQREVKQINVEHGWFEEDRTVGDDVALLTSELGEMMDAYREHGLADATSPVVEIHDEACAWHKSLALAQLDLGDIAACTCRPRHIPSKPEGFGSECADVLIRLLDTCERRGIDLTYEVERKMAYNRTRPRKHGGKRL